MGGEGPCGRPPSGYSECLDDISATTGGRKGPHSTSTLPPPLRETLHTPISPSWNGTRRTYIMKNVEMPKMGDTMEEGKILRWIKQEGDPVKKGDPLAEVETDKVNIEIEAFASGTLRKILVSEGSSAPIGAPIALIGTPDEPLPSHLGGNGAQASVSVSPSTPGARTQHTHGSQTASLTSPATV